jgi:hypothetical protein
VMRESPMRSVAAGAWVLGPEAGLCNITPSIALFTQSARTQPHASSGVVAFLALSGGILLGT